MISVKEYYPSKELAPFVERYYNGLFNTSAEPNSSIKIVPNGCLELIIHLKELYCKLPSGNSLSYTPDYMLIGMFSRSYHVHFSAQVPVFSIRFKPEALPHILRVKGSELFENYGDIEALLDKQFLDFCHRIREDKSTEAMIARTEKFLLQVLSKQKIQENYVTKAVKIIYNSQTNHVHEISEKVSISQRQLERKFREWIGLSPKQYLRLIRINKVIEMLRQNQSLNLTDIAYYCGYFDQAHFIKDFKHVTNQTPSSFIREQQLLINF